MNRGTRLLVALFGGTIVAAASTASAQSVDFPAEGRPITILVGFSAGGPTDVGTRTVVPFLEKELGTEIQVVNKPGASQQLAITDLVTSEPDGYTLAMVAPPTVAMTYLDPERQAPYGRDDIQPVSLYTADANLVVVPADSPFQSVEDLIEAAKANPNEIRVGTSGLMTSSHLSGVQLEDATDVEFAFVQFNGAAPLATAMLGGNLDVALTGILATLPHERAGKMRVLGTMDDKRTDFFPGAKTLMEQGYDVYSPVTFGLIAPEGTPRAVVATLDAAMKNALSDEELKAKLKAISLTPNYESTQEFEEFWIAEEERTARLLELAKQGQE